MSNGPTWRGTSPSAAGSFAWQSVAAVERILMEGDAHTVAVYLALSICESRAPVAAKAEFFASEQNISRAAGISARRVRSHLEVLERLRVVRRFRPEGRAKLARQASRWCLLHCGPAGRNVRSTAGQSVPSEADETSETERTQAPAKTSDKEEILSPLGGKRRSFKGGGEASADRDSPAAPQSPASRPSARDEFLAGVDL